MVSYSLDFESVAEKIKKSRAKKVLLQLPDGLKPKAVELAGKLRKLTGAEIIIWAGSNYGGCDIPTFVEKEGIDVVINVGHAEYR